MEENGPSLGLWAKDSVAAIKLAEEIWEDLQATDPACGYCLIDTVTNLILGQGDKRPD